ncbi:MAG: fibronectin type III domain-containing protein, partial [Romboutsia sp.]|nr:fibronectin type III domain-containing protein [Romboutsia sp.]
MKINSFIYLSVTVIIVVLSSCRNEPILSNGNYEVSGIVYKDGNPSSNTNILLQKNNEIIDETFSSSTGHFKFENVEQGYYSLVAKQLSSNGSFLNSPTSINVNQDIFIDNLLLPKPVELLQLINRTTRTIELKWTKYSGEGFYEYKVYRHNSTALDETTGTLIHISTNNEDTTFIDSGQENGPNIGLWPNSNFYYRVYINKEYGKMGGSNILETKTKEWENEENFTVFYSLEPLMSFSTLQGYITGLDSDGNNIYVLIVEDIGGFYTNNIVKILKYDIESNTPLDTLTYDDEYIIPRALTYADGYLWVYYDDLGSPWIKKI